MKKNSGSSGLSSCARCFMFMMILLLIKFSLLAQNTDTVKREKKLNNTIKFNFGSVILYSNAIQLGYERMVKENQSINFFVGYNELPGSLNLDALKNFSFSGPSTGSGYSLGFDYRFYLAKENKHAAPHGIYLAPFASYFRFVSDRGLVYTDSSGGRQSTNLHSNVDFLSIGAVLGYQFVLGKRFVIDLILLGPSLTHYHFSAQLQEKIQGIDENQTLVKIIEAMKDKFPLLQDLSKGEPVDESGNERFWSAGFRYSINIGFRF